MRVTGQQMFICLSLDAGEAYRQGGSPSASCAGLTRPQHPLRRSQKSMRIVVDLNRCLGYAQCVPLAPDVLQLQGEEALAYDPNPDDSQRQRVARAAASCPVQAIIVEMDPPSDRNTK